MNLLDQSIIVAYLLLCVVLGIRKNIQAKNIKEYALGSGNITTFALVATLFATYISAGPTMGVVERVYQLGIFFGIACILDPFFWLVTSYIFSDNITKFKDCISLSDIMNKLYGSFGRWLTVALSIVACIAVISVQLSAAGYLTQHFTQFSKFDGIIIMALIVCINAFLGGAKSLVLTDIFQFTIFYIAIPTLCAVALADVGGINGLTSKLPKEMLTLDFEKQSFAEFASYIFYAFLPVASVSFIQRFLMAGSGIKLKKAFTNTALIGFPFAFVIFLIGLEAKVLVPDIEPNEAFYSLISAYAPNGLLGLMIAGILAILMSTANSWMNSASVIISGDLAKLLFPNIAYNKLLLIARLSTIVIMSFSIWVAAQGDSIIEIMWLGDNFWFPTLFIPILFGFKGFKTNHITFKISVASAIIATLITGKMHGSFDTLSMLIGILTSLIAFLTTHYFQVNLGIIAGKTRVNAIKKSLSFNSFFKGLKPIDDKARNDMMALGIFITFQFIPSMFEAAFSQTLNSHLEIFFRVTPLITSIVLLSNDYWPTDIRFRFLPILWQLNIAFTLCISPIMILLFSHNKVIHVIYLLLCISLASMLLKPSRIIAFYAFSFILCAMIFALSGFNISDYGIQMPENEVIALAILYAFVGFISIMIIRRNFEEKIIDYSHTADYIAHESRTPIAALIMLEESIQMTMANARVDSGRNKVEMDLEDYTHLQDLLNKARISSIKGLKLIETVLKNFDGEYDDLGSHRIGEVIKDSLVSFESNRIVNQVVDREFYGSAVGLRTIVENLLSNALKYAGDLAIITIRSEKNRLIIEDNGLGIADNIAEKIFQFGNTTHGSGRGLALCKRIADDMNWEFNFETKFGHYTRFYIDLTPYTTKAETV